MAKSKPKEIVVVGSKVKEVVKEAGLRSDGDLVQAVSDKVHELLVEEPDNEKVYSFVELAYIHGRRAENAGKLAEATEHRLAQ